MNDMELLAALGEHLDQDAPAALPRQRQRVVTASRGRRRSAVGILRLRPALTAGVAAVAVASVVGVVVGTGSGRPSPAPSTIRLDSASVTLDRAAQAIAARPYVTPRPHQWIYTKVAEYGTNTAGGKRPTFSETWVRFDGRQEAVIEGGRLTVDQKAGGSDTGTPEGAAALLRSLPTDPQALLATLSAKAGAQPRGDAAPGRDGLLFANIVQLIRNARIGAPPKTQAALYRAIATLHGVRVEKNVVDGLGRHVIGVTQGSTNSYVLLSPGTYQVLGIQSVWSGHPTPTEVRLAKIKKFNIDLPKGAITYGLVTVTTATVDHAGQR
ncbi:CU044_5270 family protein [Actinoallomurus sp. NPDC050550]|uniref:CU044_5270 family protein n=1 Tax=Actinoallomurus sp. NPDC050550 TaxID=3154937 RepID=UPI0033C601B9